jgi:hypothetical protein
LLLHRNTLRRKIQEQLDIDYSGTANITIRALDTAGETTD